MKEIFAIFAFCYLWTVCAAWGEPTGRGMILRKNCDIYAPRINDYSDDDSLTETERDIFSHELVDLLTSRGYRVFDRKSVGTQHEVKDAMSFVGGRTLRTIGKHTGTIRDVCALSALIIERVRYENTSLTEYNVWDVQVGIDMEGEPIYKRAIVNQFRWRGYNRAFWGCLSDLKDDLFERIPDCKIRPRTE